MTPRVVFSMLALAAHGAVAAPPAASAVRPVATYSIVAMDPETKQLGVAVQSHWFSVGPIVPWAEAGVGAVATQSLADVSYGPLGLDLMRAGRSAPDALRGLAAADEGRELRQVAMVDAAGRVAARTGSRCIAHAGDSQGAHVSVQANIMAKPTVWPAMLRAYDTASGDLAERMLVALEAAEAEGGDLRGRQSAALVVVSGTPTGIPWRDRVFDLRVEDHPEPLKELRRLLTVARAYALMNEGDSRLERDDMPGALAAYAAALELQPANAEIAFWTGVTILGSDPGAPRIEQALPFFRRAFEGSPPLRELLPRLVPSGLAPEDPALIQRILDLPRERQKAPAPR